MPSMPCQVFQTAVNVFVDKLCIAQHDAALKDLRHTDVKLEGQAEFQDFGFEACSSVPEGKCRAP